MQSMGMIPAPIFRDRMVLQQRKRIRVFGTGTSGFTGTVSLWHKHRIQAEETVVVTNGKWLVELDPMAAGEGYQLLVRSSQGEILYCFQDVAIGEVWLAAGQSNMEYFVENEQNASCHLKRARENKEGLVIRYYDMPRLVSCDEQYKQQLEETVWQDYSNGKIEKWSAVAFLYAEELARELGVPIGIIGCNLGGTSIVCWLPKEMIQADASYAFYLETPPQEGAGRTPEQEYEDWQEYLTYAKQWSVRVEAAYAKEPSITWEKVQEIAGVCRYPGPMNRYNPLKMGGLYESMIQKVAPYALQGFLYYQGEEDAVRYATYQSLLELLVSNWREIFKDMDLPILLVQLPMHRVQQEKDTRDWAHLREAQWMASKNSQRCYLAVAIDCGERNNIHPAEKGRLARRLAGIALGCIYQRKEFGKVLSPQYRSHRCQGDTLCISFEDTGGGIVCKDDLMEGFELAAVDAHYYPAKARVEGNQIYLSACEVSHPVYARYLWTDYAEVTIYGKNDLPLAPFRTSTVEENITR